MLLKKLIKNWVLILFLICTLKKTINCECNCGDSTCNKTTCIGNNGENCKFFYGENKCLSCALNENDYYKINTTENRCDIIESKDEAIDGLKVIFDDNENPKKNYEVITDNCPPGFEKYLGDYCFPSGNNNIIQDPNLSSSYKCIKFFYIENKKGFTFYNCINVDEQCPQEKQFYETGNYSCLEECPTEKKFYEIGNYSCLVDCPREKKFYEIGNYSCLEDCPREKKFYEIGNYSCLEDCPKETKFYVEGTNICLKECPRNNQYHINESYICRNKCPENYTYHLNGKYECFDECPEGYRYIANGTSICYDKCPSSYKYFENLTRDDNNINEKVICYLNSCPKNKTLIKKVTIDNSIRYRCTDKCEDDEFLYNETDPDSGQIINSYCLNECPTYAKYYYNESTDITEEGIKIRECLSSCITNHFSIQNICFKDCNNYISVDISKKAFTCLDTIEICPNLYPYLYKNGSRSYCLKSCKDTQNDYFKIDNKIIYTYLNTTKNLKECIAENIEGFYIDEISLKWVQDCKTSNSGPYHNETHCRTSCDKYFNYDDLKCMDNCSENDNEIKYLDEETKTCYEKCPQNLNRGFNGYINNTEIFICQSCNNPVSKNEIKIGIEGYHLSNETICYENCSQKGDNYYNNDGENICFYGGCNNKYNYIYKPFDANVCYKSCKDIENGTYNKLVDNTCYQNISELNLDNYYHYIDSSEIDRYVLKEKAFAECSKLQYYYLNDTQCISNCRENDYKILPTNNKLGYCIGNLSDLPENYKNYTFYDKSRILKDICDLLEIQNLTDQILENDGNCADKCPDFYYEYTDINVCRNNCISDYFILKEGNRTKCVNETECPNFKYKNTEKICVDKCYYQNDGNNYSYYDLNTKYCYDICLESGKYNFSHEAINDHQPCLSNCNDQEYYLEDEKICREDCGDYYYSKENKQLCVKHCEDGEYIHPGNICSNITCPSSAPFYYELNYNISEDIGSSSGTTIKLKKCVSNCKDYEFNYTLYEIREEDPNDKKCVEKCKNFKYNDRCYNKCPEGLYVNISECVPQCKPNIFKDINGNLTCIGECPKYLTSYGKCIEECPEEENYINLNKKNCSTTCGNDFFRKINKTYINESNYDIYECVTNCNEKEVYVDGKKECLPKCDNNLYFHTNNTLLGGICYRNCKSIDLFSTIKSNNDSTLICDEQCNNNTSKNYGNDKICRPNCDNFVANKIINKSDNSCINQCDLNSEYKYFQTKTNGQTYCQQNCDGNETDNNYNRVLMPNYICAEKCSEPNNFVVLDDSKIQLECLSKCPSNDQYAQYNIERNEYFCTNYKCNTTNYTFYYSEKKICLDQCNNNDYIIYDTNICITSCRKKRLFYDDINKTCVPDCKLVNGRNFT